MPIDRRMLLTMAAAAAFAAPRMARAADEGHALFWRVTAPDRPDFIIFGYSGTPAAVTPDIVRDGKRFVDETASVLTDFSPTVTFPKVEMLRKDATPAVTLLRPEIADQLRQILLTLPLQMQVAIDQLSPLEVVTFLQFEGQTPITPTTPSVGGVIADHARAANRPFTVLIGDAELQAMWTPPDLAAINRSLDAEKIEYLVNLRKRVGPIGGHMERLYRARQSAELADFTTEVYDRHAIFSLSRLLPEAAMRTTAVQRLTEWMSAANASSAFVTLPFGTLPGDKGVIAELRRTGSKVTPIA